MFMSGRCNVLGGRLHACLTNVTPGEETDPFGSPLFIRKSSFMYVRILQPLWKIFFCPQPKQYGGYDYVLHNEGSQFKLLFGSFP